MGNGPVDWLDEAYREITRRMEGPQETTTCQDCGHTQQVVFTPTTIKGGTQWNRVYAVCEMCQERIGKKR